jgi:16S rRNA processing protein RimM
VPSGEQGHQQRLVTIGEIGRPHGLRGELRVTLLSDDPDRLAEVRECVLWDAESDRREPVRIVSARPHGGVMLMVFDGFETVEAARTLVGRLLAVPGGEARPLPEGFFYPWQLEGCRVVTEAGEEVGVVVGLEQSAAHDLWVVRAGAREHLVPAVPEIVKEVDLAARRVTVRLPDGLLDL